MADEAVNAFLGRGGDDATRNFLKSTKDYKDYEPDFPVEPPQDNTPSVLSNLWNDITNAVGGVVQSIDGYYTNSARQRAVEMADDTGRITPESVQAYEAPQDANYQQGWTGDYEQPEANPMMQALADPSYNINSPMQDPNTFGYNARREMNEWGSNLAQDAAQLGTDIVDSLTATSWQDLQDHDNTAGGDAWKVYSDLSRPAGMLAMTPVLPAPARAIAGAFYAPKMLADIRGMYEQGSAGNPETGEEGSALGGVAKVGHGMLVDPLVGLAHDITNIGGLAEDIQKNPSQIFDRLLAPGLILEGGYRGGKKAYETGKEFYDVRGKTVNGMLDDLIPHADDAAGESGGYKPISEGESAYGRAADRQAPEPVPEPAEGTGAYEAGSNAWMGETMPNGSNGCVDAVVRIGSYYDSFLKDEADRGIAYVPTLVDDAKAAGREVIPFDETRLEKGDVIVYGDNDHVVTYDGNGGYVGNSSSLQRVVHGGDYTQMGGLTPTKIIKTGAKDAGEAGREMPRETAEGVPAEEPAAENGPVRDVFGRELGEEEPTRPVEETVERVAAEEPKETPEQAAAREAKYKEKYSDLDEEIERLEAERQRDIDDEVQRMNDNPGGFGNDIGHTETLDGRNIRWSDSHNPQWYSDAYKKLGRAPRKSEYAQLAEETLSQFKEFGKRDEEIRWLKDVRDQLKANPDLNIGDVMRGYDDNLVAYEKKAGAAGRAKGIGEGYKTESGRPLDEASPDEFIVKNDGDKNFGTITPEISKSVYDKTGEILPPGNIRLKVGDIKKGAMHTRERHAIEIGGAGYSSVTDIVSDIAQNFDLILKREPKTDGGHASYSLIKLGNKNSGIMNGVAPFYLELESDGHGSYYAVVTAVPKGDKSLARQIKKEHLIYSRPGLDATSLSSAKSGTEFPRQNTGAVENSRPTSGRLSASSTSNIPRNEAEGNTLGKNNLTQADHTNWAGMGTLERGEAVPDKNGNAPISTLPKAKSKGVYEGEVTNKGIFDRIRELFGTIRTGRVPRDTNGVYDRGTDVARVDTWANWDTMWHEIGHKIDQYLGLSDKAGTKYLSEFNRVLSEKYDGNIPYRSDQFTPEGIAEFMKTYMMKGEDAARQKFPKYFEDWKAAVSNDKDLSNRVAEMRDAMQKYNDLPGGGKIKAGIQPRVEPTFKEKVKDFVNHFIENWIDDKWGLKQAEKEAEKIIGRKLTSSESAYLYARIAMDRGTDAAAQLLTGKDAAAVTKALNKLYGGVLDKVVTLPQIIDKLDHLNKTGKAWLKEQGFKDYSEALSSYLIANSFLDAYNLKEVKPFEEARKALEEAQGRLDWAEKHLQTVSGEAAKQHMRETYEQAKKDVETAKANFEAARNKHYRMPLSHEEYETFVKGAPKELQQAAQDIYDLNHNILKIMEHGGLISKELREALERDHPHYASLARVFEDDANAAGMGFGPSKSFVNVTNNLKRLTDEGSVRDVHDPLQTMTQNIVKTMTAVERNKVGQKFTDMSEMYGVGGIVEKVTGSPKTLDSTFYVWRNGEKQTYQTTPEIYRSLKSLKPEGMDSFIKLVFGMPAKFMRAGAVIYNPAFLAKNLLRDQLTAYLYSNYGYKPFYDMAKGIFHMLKQDDIYHEFKTSGVNMSSILYDSQTIVPDLMKAWQKRGLRSKIFRAINPATSLPALSNFIEQSTRIGLYGRARSKGASIFDATMEAREGTLDFGRAGVKGREWNRAIPFFNAVIQDPVLFMEKFKKNPARAMKRCAPMVMGSLALYALIQSDDQTAKEYDEMMPYEKNMFWNIPVPKSVSETGWVRYPKPFGPGFLFASLPERLADYAKGHDKTGKGLKEWSKGFLEQFVPVSMPPLFQAVYEWKANYSTFRDRSVVPQREQKLPNAMQYGTNTSEVAKAIGSALDLSPRKVDNLGQNLFAGAWSSANNAIDTLAGKKRNNNPLSTLTVDPYRAPQSIQDFYDAMDKAEKKYNGEKLNGKPSGTATANHKMLAKANKAMTELNKQERAAIAAGDDAKVDIINRKQLKLAQSALAQMKK